MRNTNTKFEVVLYVLALLFVHSQKLVLPLCVDRTVIPAEPEFRCRLFHYYNVGYNRNNKKDSIFLRGRKLVRVKKQQSQKLVASHSWWRGYGR